VRSSALTFVNEQFIAPDANEAAQAVDLQRYLADEQDVTALVGSDGEKHPLPRSVCAVLTVVLGEMAKGNAVAVVPVHHELTTQEAADLLNVSRPFLVSLVERGDIPHTMVGKHRRLRFADLIEYRNRRDETRSAALARLAAESAELGL
jgi:excisionase family DNA binding protein